MAFENDWRIKDRPWDYLKNAELRYVQQYRPLNSPWDHEHCTFCFWRKRRGFAQRLLYLWA